MFNESDAMNYWYIGIFILLLIISFFFYLFGILNIFPLYLTAAFLFFSIFLFLSYINYHNQFKGFKK
jgi:hypothetical protein